MRPDVVDASRVNMSPTLPHALPRGAGANPVPGNPPGVHKSIVGKEGARKSVPGEGHAVPSGNYSEIRGLG